MACELTMGLAEPGTGAPLHVHEADELIVVLEGRLEAKVGDAVQVAGPDHTVAVPSGTPHTFKVVGDRPARILIFFPHPHPFKHTTYLEGTRPAGV
jgi:quercetin dioxygenase-like cupin family protein